MGDSPIPRSIQIRERKHDIRRCAADCFAGHLYLDLGRWLEFDGTLKFKDEKVNPAQLLVVFSGLVKSGRDGRERVKLTAQFNADITKNILLIRIECADENVRNTLTKHLKEEWGGEVHNFVNGYIRVQYRLSKKAR